MYNADYLSPPQSRGAWLSKLTPKRLLASGLAAVLIIAVAAAGSIYLKANNKVAYSPKLAESQAAPAAPESQTPPAPTTMPSILTGLPVAPEDINKPAVGIMIENSVEARPQSGLIDAGVVFEAIAEAGITRFMAIYQDKLPGLAGPVRSARPYYVQWAKGFDAALTHVGGSPDGLAEIRSTGTPDIDDVGGLNGPIFRIKDRFAPHNAYTDASRLTSSLTRISKTSSNFTWAKRKDDAPLPTPTATNIAPTISRYTFNPVYNYDKASNSYLRSQAGQKHLDKDSGGQLSPKVVIVMKTNVSLDDDGLHMVYKVVGSGEATVFQDGGSTQGRWTKSSVKDSLQITDSTGAEISLNRGQVWITVIGADKTVTFTP